MYSAPIERERECSNSRGISLLSGQRVLSKTLRARAECAMNVLQYGFRQGSGCMDQVFATKQVCEKYLANRKNIFWEFVDF